MFEGTGSKVGDKTQFYSSSFAKHGVARLLIICFIARDRPLSKLHSPWPTGVAHKIYNIIESPLGWG